MITAGSNSQSLYKTSIDSSRYTSVGNLALTVTNYGTLGNGFSQWPMVPSCEFPRGSRVEHLFLGGIWIGGILRQDGTPRVSTAAVDIGSVRRLAEGFELTNEIAGVIVERSMEKADANGKFGISHQDFVMDFSDRYTRIPATGDSIPNHTPLGVDIHLETYAWNYPFANSFVILNYLITNATAKTGHPDTIEGLYVGLWSNGVVRNTNLTGSPRGRDFYNHSAKGYIDSLRLGYTFDFDGSPYGPPANSYYAEKLLGTNPLPLRRDSLGNYDPVNTIDSLSQLSAYTYYNAWKFNNRQGTTKAYYYPELDNNPGDPFLGKYQRLSTKMPKPNIEAFNTPVNVPVASDPTVTGEAPASATDLLSVGPFRALKPGDTVQVVFAIVCAKKSGVGKASDDYKTATLRNQLYTNASWAQQAYEGAEIDSLTGKTKQFTLPTPPRQPRVRSTVDNQRATIYWDRTQAEETKYPSRYNLAFEGYRIYRSAAGADINNLSDFLFTMQLAADFDRSDDSIGFNTGFAAIRLDTPKVFPGDTVRYWYRFPPKGDNITSLNGWQYLYAVSAYNTGDAKNGLESRECAPVIVRVVPGTLATSDEKVEIGVYPNPYYANAAWDNSTERTRKIYFYNLPARAEVKIYTLTGDLVAEFTHDPSYNGSGIKWFDDYSRISEQPQFAGGEHAWDLITKFDQAVSTGLYLFTVKDLATGTIKRGKFVIVK